MIMTASDVREVSGISPKSLRGIIERGAIGKRREGKGVHWTFTMPELVAVAYGARCIEAGLGRKVVDDVVKFLASFSETKLRAEFKEGRTIMVPIPGFMRLSEPLDDNLVESWLDMEKTYNEMKQAVEKLAGELKPQGRGRRRGLATK